MLGHVQRGGSPTARDRVLATRFGLRATLVHEGGFGRMAALQGDVIVDVALADAVAERKTVLPDWYAVARVRRVLPTEVRATVGPSDGGLACCSGREWQRPFVVE